MNNIQWLFFDVGGVLTDESSFTDWIQEHATELISKYDPTITLQKVKDARPTASAMIGNLNENMIKVFLSGDDLAHALQEWKTIRKNGPTHAGLQIIKPEALEVVRSLSEKYNLGLIANQHKEMKTKLEKEGILKYFKHSEVSEDYGVEKPDPKYFELVLQDLGVKPENSLIVDDNLERSILPAKKLGITTVWLNQDSRKVDLPVADYVISTLEELQGIL